VSAEDAIRRGMVDRFFPTTELAVNYTASYASRLALKADLDYMDNVLFGAGDRDAIDRISSRAAAFHTEPVAGELRESARVKADRDYVKYDLRIAERL
jgi:hypothetical protein